MNLNDIRTEAYINAREKGFWDGQPNIAEKLALIHSEVSEALEELRSEPGLPLSESITLESTGKPVGFASELADIIVRVCDLAGYLSIDLDKEVVRKMAYNRSRPRKHGKVF